MPKNKRQHQARHLDATFKNLGYAEQHLIAVAEYLDAEHPELSFLLLLSITYLQSVAAILRYIRRVL